MPLIQIYWTSGIQKLVLAGRMGEAIDTTQQLYPGLLEHNTNLLFMLKCRQFVEMVNGTDSEVRGPAIRSPKSHHSSGSNSLSPNMSPVHTLHTQRTAGGSGNNSPNRSVPVKGSQSSQGHTQNSQSDLKSITEEEMNAANVAMNGSTDTRIIDNEDVEMIDGVSDDVTISNGVNDGMYLNGNSHDYATEEMGRYTACTVKPALVDPSAQQSTSVFCLCHSISGHL